MIGRAGLPPIRLHDLRHGAASLAQSAGVDIKTIQHQLGHSNIRLTADTYTTVLPPAAREAADATATYLIAASKPGAEIKRQIGLTRDTDHQEETAKTTPRQEPDNNRMKACRQRKIKQRRKATRRRTYRTAPN
ncbi:tyrosine-type recombinase/integrase [Micromonospora sp. D93]|uniref:tyrosine-type recombinase/integrase n=1 Tax=Micromonospora sp. D93 TaxID=2824886 RepID=UPI001FFC4E5D|nr:tyrosine-type recombinase/integrase [Micromonospora sp. D93]